MSAPGLRSHAEKTARPTAETGRPGGRHRAARQLPGPAGRHRKRDSSEPETTAETSYPAARPARARPANGRARPGHRPRPPPCPRGQAAPAVPPPPRRLTAPASPPAGPRPAVRATAGPPAGPRPAVRVWPSASGRPPPAGRLPVRPPVCACWSARLPVRPPVCACWSARLPGRPRPLVRAPAGPPLRVVPKISRAVAICWPLKVVDRAGAHLRWCAIARSTTFAPARWRPGVDCGGRVASPSRAVLVATVTEVRRAAHHSSTRSVPPAASSAMSSGRR